EGNVTVEIRAEERQVRPGLHLEVGDQPTEHVRYHVLPPERESRRDARERLRSQGVERPRHEGASGLWRYRQRGFDRFARAEAREERIDGSRVGSALFHCGAVELEMAAEAAEAVLVALLAENDLIDQPACRSI